MFYARQNFEWYINKMYIWCSVKKIMLFLEEKTQFCNLRITLIPCLSLAGNSSRSHLLYLFYLWLHPTSTSVLSEEHPIFSPIYVSSYLIFQENFSSIFAFSFQYHFPNPPTTTLNHSKSKQTFINFLKIIFKLSNKH